MNCSTWPMWSTPQKPSVWPWRLVHTIHGRPKAPSPKALSVFALRADLPAVEASARAVGKSATSAEVSEMRSCQVSGVTERSGCIGFCLGWRIRGSLAFLCSYLPSSSPSSSARARTKKPFWSPNVADWREDGEKRRKGTEKKRQQGCAREREATSRKLTLLRRLLPEDLDQQGLKDVGLGDFGVVAPHGGVQSLERPDELLLGLSVLQRQGADGAHRVQRVGREVGGRGVGHGDAEGAGPAEALLADPFVLVWFVCVLVRLCLRCKG